MDTLKWGIVGTGAIARTFLHGLGQTDSGRAVAVGSRQMESAEAFAEKHGIGRAHGAYEALLEDPEVEAVYVSTPHPFHAEWTIRALEAGKHVLCEKPLALNQWQAQEMIEAARRSGTFLAEAFMYRCHPQTARIVERVRSGAIGEVRLIRASFGFDMGDAFDPKGRLFDPQLGGGGILDVGCYPVSMARLVAGAAEGRPFADPVKVTGAGKLGETGVDEWAAGVLQFASGIIAQVSTGIRAQLDNSLVVFGSKGRLEVANPWTGDRVDAVNGAVTIVTRDGETVHPCPAGVTSFALEAEAVARAIRSGKTELGAPGMNWADSLGNLATLDRWREAVGLTYPDEKPAPRRSSLSGRPVRVRTGESGHGMRYGRIPGLEKPVSRFIYGALAAHGSFAKAQVLFDHWLEVGGNAFDTGWIYGPCDAILGHWLVSRGVREEVVLIAKGAHTPHCNPEGVKRELSESLERLRTGYADIYILHRDNPDIPVGEFIDVLNEQVEAGRIGVFGGSNWSPKRFAEANIYAHANGKQGMTVLNNNLSLARMVDPVWPGCIHLSDPESRQWMEQEKVVHLSWSSQARGFFTERTEQELSSPGYDTELRRSWISEDNLRRRERAIELARTRGVLPINIAAAWVLCQPFESFALIGPETVHEMETSLPGLEIELTREEIAYLWGG